MATLQTETEHKLKDMATGQRASEYQAQWCLDMLSAAIAHMVEQGLFPSDAHAEGEMGARAEEIQRERAANPEAVST